jgi:2-(1,2-epoxy-1,2-dihydrophenyl)acetyl-CoA isomerase
MSDVIVLDKKEDYALITLNASQKGNAYNEAMAAALWQAVQEVRWDENVKAVLMQSNGGLFSGGGDIGAFQRGIELQRLPALVEDLSATLNATVLAMRGMDKIFISLVEGVCAGFGIGLALAADVTLVTENARFVAGYIGIGAVPDGGSSFAVLRALGLPRALDFFLTNGVVEGPQAVDMGLVSRLVAVESAREEAMDLLKNICRGPSRALARTKKVLIDGVSRNFADYIEAERQGIIACAAGEEMREGVAAFLAKRPPRF